MTGFGVLQMLDEQAALLQAAAHVLKTSPKEVVRKAEALLEELKESRRETDSLKSRLAKDAMGSVMDDAKKVGSTLVVAKLLDDNMDMNTLREVGDQLKQQCEDAVLVLASKDGGKVNVIAMATPAAVSGGAHAGKIVSQVAKAMGGGGGGKPESAQAGGKDPEKAEAALAMVEEIVAAQQK